MDELEMFTVYFNPSDYPGKYVVRRFIIRPGEPRPDPEPIVVTESITAARSPMQRRGLYRIDRIRGDEPCIVEVWV